MPPLESTHRELSFEWMSLDSSGFRSFLGTVKFAFGSERVNNNIMGMKWERGLFDYPGQTKETAENEAYSSQLLCYCYLQSSHNGYVN